MPPNRPWMLTVASLRQKGARPRYFGLGFIQINLDERRRLHCWVPEWPTIPGAESEFHDHRAGFTSQVLLGAVEHQVVAMGELRPSPAPELWEVAQVSCQAGVEGKPEIQGHASVFPLASFRVQQGGEYQLSVDAFHRSRAVGPTITLVERGETIKKHALVLRRPGSPFVCPFSLAPDEAACWAHLEAMLDQDPPVWVPGMKGADSHSGVTRDDLGDWQ